MKYKDFYKELLEITTHVNTPYNDAVKKLLIKKFNPPMIKNNTREELEYVQFWIKSNVPRNGIIIDINTKSILAAKTPSQDQNCDIVEYGDMDSLDDVIEDMSDNINDGINTIFVHPEVVVRYLFGKDSEKFAYPDKHYGTDHLDESSRMLTEEFKDCVMAEVPPTQTNETEESVPVLMSVYSLIEEIPDDILYTEEEGHGKETWPHITILYGLEDGQSEESKKIVEKYKGKIKATLGKISKFENEKFDVLKIDVTSEDLSKINKELKSLPNENKYPDYKAHVTLAYVKKGEGEDYVGRDDFDGMEIEIDKVIYSDNNRNHKRILEEYFVGVGGGYGGAAGGTIAANGWAACYGPTPHSMMSKYPIQGGTKNFKGSITQGTQGSRYNAMNGNTVMSSAPYENVNDEDLEVDGIDRDELFLGIRYEMKHVDFPSKEMAKEKAVENLRKDPNYYSGLKQFMDNKVNIKEIVSIVDAMKSDRDSKSSAVNNPYMRDIQDAIMETAKGRGIKSIVDIIKKQQK